MCGRRVIRAGTLSKILGHASVKTTWDIYGTEGLRDIQINYTTTVAAMFGGDVRSTKKPNRC